MTDHGVCPYCREAAIPGITLRTGQQALECTNCNSNFVTDEGSPFITCLDSECKPYGKHYQQIQWSNNV